MKKVNLAILLDKIKKIRTFSLLFRINNLFSMIHFSFKLIKMVILIYTDKEKISVL